MIPDFNDFCRKDGRKAVLPYIKIQKKGAEFTLDTIIEIYDKEPLLNVLAPSVIRPARVIYIGARPITGKRLKKKLVRYFALRSPETYAYFYPVNIYDCEDVQRVLSDVLERYPDAAVDITGGSSTLAFAVGIFCSAHNVPVFAYHHKENSFCNVYHCEELDGVPCDPQFTVEEVLAMAGGMFLRHGHVATKDIDAQFLDDIGVVFSLCYREQGRWNHFVQYLQMITGRSERSLSVAAPLAVMNNAGKMRYCDVELLEQLEENGLVYSLSVDESSVSFRFRNHVVRQCLIDTGVWLELYVYKEAVECGCFDDVQISVVVDWNGVANEPINTINEIDVVLTRGITPVFISCKYSVPSTTALNEIKTLTDLFGGGYARGVLVTLSDLAEISPATYQRAEDMNIDIIQDEDFERGNVASRLIAISSRE